MATRRALLIGIDHYDPEHVDDAVEDLSRAAGDAETLAGLLGHDHDDTERWAVTTLTDTAQSVTGRQVKAAIHAHYDVATISSDADLLLYFAGHAVKQHGDTQLQAYDGDALAFTSLMASAELAGRTARSVTIILDCCMSGDVAGVASSFATLLAVVPENTTILTASRPSEQSFEIDGGEGFETLFTHQLIGGLRGAAADLLGNVTALSLYAHASTGIESRLRRIAGVTQTPMFKCNTDHPVLLRRAQPQIGLGSLVALPEVFGSSTTRIGLTPHHEGLSETRVKDPDDTAYETDPSDPDHGANDRSDVSREPYTGSLLQIENDRLKDYRNAGLLATYANRDFYWLTHEPDPDKNWVELNQLGRYYWQLADDGRLESEFTP